MAYLTTLGALGSLLQLVNVDLLAEAHSLERLALAFSLSLELTFLAFAFVGISLRRLEETTTFGTVIDFFASFLVCLVLQINLCKVFFRDGRWKFTFFQIGSFDVDDRLVLIQLGDR